MSKIITFGVLGAVACLVGALCGEVLFHKPAIDKLPSAAVIGSWSVLLAITLSIGLVLGQNIYLRRRPLLGFGQAIILLVGAVLAGAVAGVAGEFLFSILKGSAASLSDTSRIELAKFVGWFILGGLLGLCLSLFVPNLSRFRAAIAGALGGLAAAWAFLDFDRLLGETAARLTGAAILGLFIGIMIALVERVFRETWLEVVFGPGESRIVALGREPVSVGSASGSMIYARNAAPTALRFRMDEGKVLCEDVPTGRVDSLAHDASRQAGNVTIFIRGTVKGGKSTANTNVATTGGFALKLPGKAAIPLTDGKVFHANEFPGIDGTGKTAEVSVNPKDKTQRGLKNLTPRPWSAINPSGEKVKVEPGRSIKLATGTRVDFGGLTGEIQATSPHLSNVSAGKSLRIAVAALLAIGLVSLGAVDWKRRQGQREIPVAVKNGSTGTQGDLPVIVHDRKNLPEEKAAKPLRLEVVAGQFDDVGRLLRQMGTGYEFGTLSLNRLEEPSWDAGECDVIFLACGAGIKESSDTKSDSEKSESEKEQENAQQSRKDEQIKQNLRRFVGNGGTLYASCLNYSRLAKCFPEFVGDPLPDGDAQELKADVVDEGLRDLVGANLPLNFDKPGWPAAAFKTDKATVYLRATYKINVKNDESTEATGPLLIKLPFDRGNIIFTSFHNGEQNSERELALLRHLVFAAVTAKVESEVRNTMMSDGFTPQKENLLTSSPEAPSVEKTYTTTKPCKLLFALGFSGENVRMQLKIEGPNGKFAVRDSATQFVVEVPDAPAGEWKYTVTALQNPNSSYFPFTVTVGEK